MRPLSPTSLALVLFAVTAACAKHSGFPAPVVTGATPSFETRTEITTGTSQHSDYVVADFDGDTKLDMAVISISGELRILIGNGTNFVMGQPIQIGGVPSWMDSGDFDNNGDLDLVIVRSAENSTDIWLNDGFATFSAGASLPVGSDALSVAVGDLDDDGNLDVAVSVPLAPEIAVAFGDGTGAFPNLLPLALPGGGIAFSLTIGDVTRDDRDDLLVADPQMSRVVLVPNTGSAAAFGADACELQIPGAPGATSLGDLSGDGLPDVVVSAFTGNRYVVVTDILPPIIKEGAPAGVPACDYQSFDIPVPARPGLTTVADVTGDGLPDLVACLAFSANLCVAPQLPGGGVGEAFHLDSTGLPLRPFVGDFDKNGRNDVFALSGLGDRINLWLANSSGRVLGARNYGSGLPGSSWIEGGDFDGDGDFEVVVGSLASSQLSWLGRDTGGVLRSEFVIDVGSPIDQIEAVDLDADGRPDLVVGVPGGVRIVRNLSTPGAYDFEVLPTSPVTFGSGDFPFGIALGDFDRDGDMDIALCDFAGGGLHIVQGTPDPFVFGAETVVAVGGGPIDVVAADFSGDGLLDLAVSRSSNSDILVLRNEGAVGFTEFLSVPVGVTPNYLITADFNRDGRADLVVSNANSDSVTVLFGNANGFTGLEFAAGLTPTALMAKDLTGDGIDDILVASLRSGDFRVLVGDGRGGFPLLPTFPGTLGASDALLQDMDGDDLPELMITSLITNRVSMVRNITEIAPEVTRGVDPGELMGVILAAGKGTRMRPFSEHWPKPILPVLGKPLMAYQLEMMAGLGIRSVVVVIGHLGHEVVRALGDGSRYGVSIQYVEQEEMLGIAHAVSRLEPHVDRPFFLFLGDIFFATENLGSMIGRFRNGDGLGGVLACKREPNLEAIKRNFIVLTRPDGTVHRVVEKPRHPRTDLKGCGIYLFDLSFFDAVRRTPRTAMRNEYEITDSIQIFLDDGYKVEAAEVVRADMNVSYPADLLELNLLLLQQSGQPNFVDAGVQVASGATLENCVVMAGAQVGQGTALEDCLLFPGAVVPAGRVRRRSIFTADAEIRCTTDEA